jgi:hypothetical protein
MTPLELAHQTLQKRRLAGETFPRLDPIAKAAANPRNRKLAIAAKCWDCIGAGADPNPRGAIRECPSENCPLWPVRPYQRKAP